MAVLVGLDGLVAPPALAQPTTAPGTALADQIEALLRQSDERYWTRGQPGNAEASYEAARQARELDPDNYEACWRVARAAAWICDGAADPTTRVSWGKLGWDAAIAGTAINRAGVEAQFWGASSLGCYAEGVGVLKTFFDGLGKQYERWIRRALELNPRYANGGPYRALGRYYFTTPGIAGGDNQMAIKYLEQSKQVAPDLLRTRAWLAEVYLDEGETDKAKSEIEFCLGADPARGDLADNQRVQPMCAALKQRL